MTKQYAKASEVIAAIRRIVNVHGDLPLVLRDPDTHRDLPVCVRHALAEPAAYHGAEMECIQITSDYHGEPEGYVSPGVQTDSPSISMTDADKLEIARHLIGAVSPWLWSEGEPPAKLSAMVLAWINDNILPESVAEIEAAEKSDG